MDTFALIKKLKEISDSMSGPYASDAPEACLYLYEAAEQLEAMYREIEDLEDCLREYEYDD